MSERNSAKNTAKKVVVSGMRPTGKLHLGHYFGVLKNWIQLQEEYECYFFVADWHALTTEYTHPEFIRKWSYEMVFDWLSVGLDPERCTLFLQSQVVEHAELQVLLGMITPLSWLERVPSYKELKNELKDRDLSTYGFLGYPLLQTADVALYNADLVPVGQDQVPHLELSREIVRRFNHLYGETFVEPKPLLTEESKLLGTDGRKMSKSYQNAIELSESPESLQKKMMACLTDPARARRSDPGNPDVCTLYSYHKIFTSEEKQAEIYQACQTASIGCVDCKKIALQNMESFLAPLRAKRQALEVREKEVETWLDQGAARAKQKAQGHLKKIYQAMGLSPLK